MKGLTWAQLFVEEQWSCSAYLALEQKRWTADLLTEQPCGRPPAGAACWDMLWDIPEATKFCVSCNRFRPGETGLSHVEVFEQDTRRRVLDRWCRM